MAFWLNRWHYEIINEMVTTVADHFFGRQSIIIFLSFAEVIIIQQLYIYE